MAEVFFPKVLRTLAILEVDRVRELIANGPSPRRASDCALIQAGWLVLNGSADEVEAADRADYWLHDKEGQVKTDFWRDPGLVMAHRGVPFVFAGSDTVKWLIPDSHEVGSLTEKATRMMLKTRAIEEIFFNLRYCSEWAAFAAQADGQKPALIRV